MILMETGEITIWKSLDEVEERATFQGKECRRIDNCLYVKSNSEQGTYWLKYSDVDESSIPVEYYADYGNPNRAEKAWFNLGD